MESVENEVGYFEVNTVFSAVSLKKMDYCGW